MDSLSYPPQKIILKCVLNINVKNENALLLKEDVRKKLLEVDLGNDFWDMLSKSQATKAKINKWADIKLKSSIQQKKESQNEKAVYGMEENICKLFIW